jgi:hypothetical protein
MSHDRNPQRDQVQTESISDEVKESAIVASGQIPPPHGRDQDIDKDTPDEDGD